MDDGSRCQLIDVISDSQLLESFLENGNTAGINNTSTTDANSISGTNSLVGQQNDATSKQPQSVNKVVKKAAKVHKPEVRNTTTDGKNSKRKADSPASRATASNVKTDRKNSKNSKKSAAGTTATPAPTAASVPVIGNCGLSLQVPNSQSVVRGMMLPQQLVQMAPGGLQHVVPGLNGPMILTRPQNQAGTATAPVLQFIQTSNGQAAQLISLPVQSNAPQIVTKPTSSPAPRAVNKQILPKPSSAPSSAPVTSLAVATSSQSSVIRAATVAGSSQPVTLAPNHLNTMAPQFILSGQTPSLIQGPNGTLILNTSSMQTIGGQQFIVPNNGLGAPLQLTIRPQTVPTSVSTSIHQQSTPLLTALTSPTASSAAARPQTLFMQSPSQAAPTILTSRSPQNMVLTRNTAPVFSSPQFIQIQTPNGPMLLPLAQPQGMTTSPQILAPSSQSLSIPSSNTLVQNISGQLPGTALQSLLTAGNTVNDLTHTSVSTSNHSLIISPAASAPVGGKIGQLQKSSNSSAKGVNLEDLLKESGILENSPPSSPNIGKTSDASTVEFNAAATVQSSPQQSSHQTVFVMPSGANQTPHNLVLTQSGLQTAGLNQLRLSLTPDGNMILQPANANVPFSLQQTLPSTSNQSKVSDAAKDLVLGVSQPSPDSTTPTLDTVSRPTLSDQPVTPDIKCEEKTMSEDATVTKGVRKICQKEETPDLDKSPKVNIPSKPAAPVVLRTSDCDTQTSVQPAVVVNASPLTATTDSRKVDSDGVRISLDDKAFLDGLDTQIRNLSSMIQATDQQKCQLRELQRLQNQINEAKKNQIASGDAVKMLLTVPPVRVAGQEQLSFQTTTHFIQTNSTQQQQPGVQLVNILKPQTGIDVNVAAQPFIRLLPAPTIATTTSASEATTFQLMSNQLITISPSVKNQIQTVTAATSMAKMSVESSPVVQMSHLQTASVGTPVVSCATAVSTPVKVVDPAIEEEKRKRKTLKLFSEQLVADQASALRPDYKTPFRSVEDAGKRLLRYHVLNSSTCSQHALTQIDENFEIVARDLLIKKQLLLDRFRRCILKQSYRPEVSETVMLNRLFVQDETSAIKFDKEVVAQGMPLDLPPPPRSWQTKISSNSLSDLEEANRKRKLPVLDEDLTDHLSAAKKQSADPVNEHELEAETEDEDDDSDEDDDEDDDDANPGDDMSEYLGPNDNGNVDINSIYEEINYDTGLAPIDSRQALDLNFSDRSAVLPFSSGPQSDWRPGYNEMWQTSRYTEREAADAVESILTEDEEQNRLSTELSAAAGESGQQSDSPDDDDEEDDEDDDDDEDEDEEEDDIGNHSYQAPYSDDVNTGLRQQQPAISCDPQMQCAIDSILVDVPQQTPHRPFFSHDNYNRSYGSMPGPSLSNHRTSLASFGHSLQGQLNDPALDEAVKSILS